MSFKLEGILESPVNLCVTYDPTKFGPFVIGRSSIPEAGLYSVCCAIQNLMVSSKNRRSRTWMGKYFIKQNTKRNSSSYQNMLCLLHTLCLGYVDNFAEKPDLEISGWLPRLDLKDVVFFEKWDDKENVKVGIVFKK